MATAETDRLHESALRRADEYANRCGELMVQVDALKAQLARANERITDFQRCDQERRKDAECLLPHSGLVAVANMDWSKAAEQFESLDDLAEFVADLVTRRCHTSVYGFADRAGVEVNL